MDAETKFARYAIAVSLVAILAILRLIYVLPACSSPLLSKSKQEDLPGSGAGEKAQLEMSGDKGRLMVLFGSGGHTGEMLRILEQFQNLNTSFSRRSYVISSGDSTSISKIRHFEENANDNVDSTSTKRNIDYFVIPRARNIGESHQMAIYHTLRSIIITFFKLIKVWQEGKLPDVLLLNGPGTSIPLSYLIFLFKYFGLTSCKIVYVESLARVNRLSMTGYLIMPIANRFIVQWEKLSKAHRRCEYYGILV